MLSTRRGFIAAATGLLGAGLAAPLFTRRASAQMGNAPATRPLAVDSGQLDAAMGIWGASAPYVLPQLPYDYAALEPHIDARTMEIHHSRHHNSYVQNLNGALENRSDLQGHSLAWLLANLGSLPEAVRLAVRNNGGGHANHSLFWEVMSPDGRGEPTGALAEALSDSFGGFAEFQAEFDHAARSVFGSGWAWLVRENRGLAIGTTPNQDSPLMEGRLPILGLDVWEHAYYLHYQNRRIDYIAAWWNVVNWTRVAELFET